MTSALIMKMIFLDLWGRNILINTIIKNTLIQWRVPFTEYKNTFFEINVKGQPIASE